MAVTRLYLRNTQAGGGTGGIVYDLSATQGTGATLVSSAISSTSFTEVFRWQYTLGSDVPDTVIPTSVDVAAVSASTLEYRWKVERLDGSNNEIASSSYSTAYNTTGIKTENLSLSTAWATGDRVAISLELRRVSGGGSRTVTINVNDADSFIDPDLVPLPQALTQASRFDNSNNFYAATVSAGAVTLTPALYSNTQTFYSAQVYSQFLTAQQDFGLVTATPDVYFEWGLITETPATYTNDLGDLQAGGATQNLTAALYTNTNTFYAPTVASTYALTPARYDNTNNFYGPTVTTSNTLTAARYDNTQTFYAPTVTTSYTISAARYDNAQTFYGPTVSATYSLTAARFDNTSTFYGQTAAASNTLTPARFDNTNTFYGATVAASNTVTPDRYDNANAFYAPTVTSSVTLVAARFDNDNAFYGPTVTAGTVTLLPELYENTSVFYAPIVTQQGGPQFVVPDLYVNTNAFYAPTVSAGAIELLPPLVANDNTFYAPEVTAVGAQAEFNYRLYAIRRNRR